MNGFLLVAVCHVNEVPLRLYDEHGQHAAQIEADACNQSPELVCQRFEQAFRAVECWRAAPPYAFRVLHILGGEVAGCVYDTDAEPTPMAQDLADYD